VSLDFQQLRQQVQKMGENAPARQQALNALRDHAIQVLRQNADRQQELRHKVQLVARQFDPNLRCALPVVDNLGRLEALDAAFPLPVLTGNATILAADGSQLAPDRHAEVLFGLTNIGVVMFTLGTSAAPQLTIHTQLLYDQQLHTRSGSLISDESLALRRDLAERQVLLEASQAASSPVIALTDGPLELWGAKDSGDSTEFTESLRQYLDHLNDLHRLSIINAGYVDKPAASLVVRLLEVALMPIDELSRLKDSRLLAGVSDQDLYHGLLGPGDRSAIFAMQSKSAANYKDHVALHFFYLNVGHLDNPHLARVEIPAWVAMNADMLDALHAVLINQCNIMGSRPYPYLLHRAHETAVVTIDDKTQVTQMIVKELRERGVEVGRISFKQAAKNLPKRTRYP
jgi:hypothetical protein